MTRYRSPPLVSVRQEGLVLLLHGRPVGAVHVRVVEEVAVDPPGLVEDLLPLGPRIDAHFDRVEVEPLPSPPAAAAGAAAWPRGPAAAEAATAGRAGCAARRRLSR